ncbi:MAG: hypothetical protein WB810_02025 [Candidatus Cybelea sp.]
MRRLNLRHYAMSSCATAALLAGCGGSQPPIGASGAIPQTSGMDSLRPFSRYRSAGGDQVQYVTGAYPGSIEEFDYPRSDLPIHSVRRGHKSYAECTKGSGTFWVVEETAAKIVEFAASRKKIGKPIKTLTVPSTPWDCSVDPTTGNLEVSLIDTSSVVVFTNASGPGQVISDKLRNTGSSTYDSEGDLFVSGEIDSKRALVELPKGQVGFQEISLPSEVTRAPSGFAFIRWDGTYLAWFISASNGDVYRLSISGSQAYLESTVTLKNAGYCGWFWIWTEAGLLFCGPEGQYANVYDYPTGGSPIALLGPMAIGESVSVVSLQP